ncbi:MAG: zinc ribbon domain-containing protein [Coriobacteriia bacterium]|nr:zinc ribbon domain-containing protein [Coriobacteriia bacterium]
MSSILNSAGNLLNRGVAAAGRGTKTISLRAQINDLVKRREKLTSDLGASIYLETRYDPVFRAPRESYYSAIESIDAQVEALQAEINVIEQDAQVGAAQPVVGAPPVGYPAQQAATCSTCGVILDPADAFCRNCGAPVPKTEGAAGFAAPDAVPAAVGAVPAAAAYPAPAAAAAYPAPVPAYPATEAASVAAPAYPVEAPFTSTDDTPFVSSAEPVAYNEPVNAADIPFVAAEDIGAPAAAEVIEVIDIEPVVEPGSVSEAE